MDSQGKGSAEQRISRGPLRDAGISQNTHSVNCRWQGQIRGPQADLTSEEVGLQYPAPKTKFSREMMDCSGPMSGPPLPSQEPLPGRVKLQRTEVKKERQEVKKVMVPNSAPLRGIAGAHGAGHFEEVHPLVGSVLDIWGCCDDKGIRRWHTSRNYAKKHLPEMPLAGQLGRLRQSSRPHHPEQQKDGHLAGAEGQPCTHCSSVPSPGVCALLSLCLLFGGRT